MSTQIIVVDSNPLSRFLSAASKDRRSRLSKFVRYQSADGQPWHKPNLREYRDHLLGLGLAASTVAAHLATIRSAYKDLALDLDLRDRVMGEALQTAKGDPVAALAIMREIFERVQIATDPRAAKVKVTKKQDVADSAHLRLTPAQAVRLLEKPGLNKIKGLRDTAIVALMLCTGIREAELCGLDVKDLRQTLGGSLALHVREGKGAKERLIPYGDLDWCLVLVDAWLERTGIAGDDAAVFRGLYKSGKLRPGRLSTRGLHHMLVGDQNPDGNHGYPISIGGQLRRVRPHDLRRTYARIQFEAGLDTIAIQQNLGHSDLKTTLGYIGTLNADQRQPIAAFSFDVSQLDRLPKQQRLEGAA